METTQTMSERNISMPIWKRKVHWLFKEIAHLWEQRNSDIALFESSRELESQRLELYQSNQWPMGRSGSKRKSESSKKIAQEVAKKLRNYEESAAKKQIEPDT